MKKILCTAMAVVMLAGNLVIPAAAADYTDIQNHWAKPAIERWDEYKIVGGYADNTFKPDGQLTRAEMAVILSNLLGLTEVAENPFSDVKTGEDGDWFAPYILKCKAAGLMDGDNGMANPNGVLTREQAMLMLCKALGIQPADESDIAEYVDEKNVQPWAVPYVAALVKKGIISSTSTSELRVDPQEPMSRGALMLILHNAVEEYTPAKNGKAPAIVLVEKEDVELPSGGGGGGTQVPEEPEEEQPTEEEIAEEAQMAVYLQNIVNGYHKSTYLLTTEQVVQDAMKILMDCIEDALDKRDEGVFLSRSYIRDTYASEIDRLKESYDAMNETQLTQINNVIVRLADTEDIYYVMDYFAVSVPD